MAGAGDTSRFSELAAAFVYLRSSPNTRAAYARDLAGFSDWCSATGVDPLDSDGDDLVRYRDSCEESGASPATVARRLSSLSSFFSYAAAAGAVAGSPVRILQRPVAAASPTADLSDADVGAFLAASALLGPRTVALVNLLLYDGLRLSEILEADVDDLARRPPDDEAAALTVTRHGDDVEIPLDPQTRAALTVYLAGRTDGPLFEGASPTRDAGRLTRFGADYLLKQASEQAGLGRTVSANTLRRRHVAAAHARGDSIEEIQDRLGHADARTTRRHLPAEETTASDEG